MGLKEIYFGLEDRYYVFLDWLNKYAPVYKVIDPIDRVFPSFILVLLLFAALIIVVLVVAFSGSAPLEAFVRVVDDSGTVLKNVDVTLSLDANRFTASTGNAGVIAVALRQSPTTATASVSLPEFEELVDEPLTLTAGEYALVRLVPREIGNARAVSIGFADSDSKDVLDDRSVTISFSCDTGTDPAPQTTRTGSVVVEPPAGCVGLSANEVTAQGYQTRRSVDLSTDGTDAVTVYLTKSAAPPPATGTLSATVIDDANKPVKGATVTVYTATGATAKTAVSGTLGNASFTLPAGPYKAQATMPHDGRLSGSVPVTVEEDESESVTLSLGAIPKDKKVLYRFVDSNSGEDVEQADVTLFSAQSRTPLFSAKTDSSGKYEQAVSDTNGPYVLVADHPNYVLGIVSPVTLVGQFDTNAVVYKMTQLKSAPDGSPQNFARVQTTVLDDDHKTVQNATVLLFRSGTSVALAQKTTSSDGNVLFSRLPAGTYRAVAVKDDSNAASEDVTVNVGETGAVEIVVAMARRSVKVSAFNALAPATKINNARVEVWMLDPATQGTAKVDGGTTNTVGEFRPAKPLRVGSIVSFRVTRTDYIPFNSAWYTIYAGSTEVPFEFGMYKPADLPTDSRISMRFSDLLGASGTPGTGFVLEAGKRYTAVLNVTLSAAATEGVVNVRAGPDSLPQATQNAIFISNAEASRTADRTVFSPALNAQDVFADVAPALSSDQNAKLVNLRFDSLDAGTYQIKVVLQVKQGLSRGTVVDLRYRAKALFSDGLNTAPDAVESFTVGSAYCKTNCPTLQWAFYWSTPEEPAWKPFDTQLPPHLIANQRYRIGYVVYNLTDTAYTASVAFENRDTALRMNGSDSATANGFTDEPLPANGSTEKGLQSPLELVPSEESVGVLNALLTPDPAITQPASLLRTILFEINGTRGLDVVTSYDGARLSVLVRDALTHELLPDALIEVGQANDGTAETGFSRAPQASAVTTQSGFRTFDLSLKSTERVVVSVKKAGYATVLREVGSAIALSKADASCITLDMVSETESVVDTAVAPSFPYRVSVAIRSACAETFRVSLAKPAFIGATDLAMSPDGAFDLGAGGSMNVNMSLSQGIPKGIIPVWVMGHPKSTNAADVVLAVGEVWLSDNLWIPPTPQAGQACFGLTEKTG
jgi:hypothetical protein